MANRLAAETSPYLRQHADNPVDWYPWGDEALGRARAEDKPILLSIGYSACHWCHVMAHESFADADVARLMNERFVCVKVDREEMPDLDAIYQQVVALMGQSGGWPLTMFLTPELVPYFGGTYFPPVEGFGRPSFRRVLLALSAAWRKERDTVAHDAAAVRAALARLAERARGDAGAADTPLLGDVVERAARRVASQLDPRHGGLGDAPKFPHAQALELLWRAARRLRAAGDDEAAPLERGVRLTLDRMAAGGIYDHLGGGFARYATDAAWLVPHFEKMTYDNAQAVRLYLDAALLFGEPRFAPVARATAAYLVRDMQDPAGGFYTAQDADADGVEGQYYVWTPAALAAVLEPADAALVARCYDVTAAGNWHDPHGHGPAHASILHRVAEPADDAERARLAAAAAALLRARRERVAPATDDKVLAGVNGLVIGALAEAGRVLGEPTFVAAARRAAAFVLDALGGADGRLRRTWHGGRARLPGTLEDHAFVAVGLTTLYEATGEARWLDEALRLTRLCLDLFYDPATCTFYLTAAGDGHLIERPPATFDGPQPSGLGAALRALVTLGAATGDARLQDAARAVAGAHARAALANPLAYASFLTAVDQLQGGVTTIVLAGAEPRALGAALAAVPLPARLIVRAAGAPTALATLCAGKGAVAGRPAAYVCRDGTCLAPATDAAALRAQLAPTAAPPPAR